VHLYCFSEQSLTCVAILGFGFLSPSEPLFCVSCSSKGPLAVRIIFWTLCLRRGCSSISVPVSASCLNIKRLESFFFLPPVPYKCSAYILEAPWMLFLLAVNRSELCRYLRYLRRGIVCTLLATTPRLFNST